LTTPEPPFDAPWQAQLFALTLAMNEAGHFSWTDWAAEFGPRVQSVEADQYWQVWSEALVTLLERRGFASVSDVREITLRWQEAALATPHGQPIVLKNAPYSA
jgi:nitrile hydratase accessory protein